MIICGYSISVYLRAVHPTSTYLESRLWWRDREKELSKIFVVEIFDMKMPLTTNFWVQYLLKYCYKLAHWGLESVTCVVFWAPCQVKLVTRVSSMWSTSAQVWIQWACKLQGMLVSNASPVGVSGCLLLSCSEDLFPAGWNVVAFSICWFYKDISIHLHLI